MLASYSSYDVILDEVLCEESEVVIAPPKRVPVLKKRSTTKSPPASPQKKSCLVDLTDSPKPKPRGRPAKTEKVFSPIVRTRAQKSKQQILLEQDVITYLHYGVF